MLRALLLTGTLVLFGPGLVAAQDPGTGIKREPAFAGTFYPSGQAALRSRLQQLFNEAGGALAADVTAGPGEKVQTIIVPHAGYDYSGLVAAAAYLQISKTASYDNIFIITTSHRQQFEGISVCQAGSYNTPLGEVKVNRQLAAALAAKHPGLHYRPEAHEREQGIEVQLPFIQHQFGNLPPIVPIVIGSSSLEGARDLATALLPWFTPENLFIISADFSRYPSHADAKRIDQLTAEAISRGDPEHFYNALRNAGKLNINGLATPSGDWSAIMTMLYMADRTDDLRFQPVLYRNSGDSPLGDRQRVVGYWALAAYRNMKADLPLAYSMEEKKALLGISRATLESYIRSDSIPGIPPDRLAAALKHPATALVSLYMGGRLRGRIEYLTPATPLGIMVQEMTIASATLDRRFAPVEQTELEYITIEIAVLSRLEKITDPGQIDPLKHGIYMVKGEQSGLYLPGKAVEEGWSIEELLGHCSREKAGLGWEEWKEAEIFRFETIRFSEEDLNPSMLPAL